MNLIIKFSTNIYREIQNIVSNSGNNLTLKKFLSIFYLYFISSPFLKIAVFKFIIESINIKKM